jgi:uncharacterized protein (TIGR02444 family)
MSSVEAGPSGRGSPFWRFSLAFYRDEGVAQACLELQDDCGVDVNLLLFLLWMANTQRRLAVGEIRALNDRLSHWRAQVIEPLRAMRRMLKDDAPLIEPAKAESFRTRVKALELEAERLQQEAMYALSDRIASDQAASRQDAARANVTAYQNIKGHAFTTESVEILLRALARQ